MTYCTNLPKTCNFKATVYDIFYYLYTAKKEKKLLAALHFNENGSREQASTKTNQLRYKITFPKQKKGDFTVKKIKTPSTYGNIYFIIMNM